MAIKGIDVSEHQGKIDWKKVKNSGVQFAIIRAGYGNDISQKDKYFDYNITEAQKQGIYCGAYWFSYAISKSDAKKEANVCYEVIKPYKLEYPVYFDYEYDSVRYSKEMGGTPTKNSVVNIAVSFLSALEQKGYYVGNYTNPDFYNRYFNDSRMKPYDIWVAHYGVSKPSVSGNIWQYSSTGSVSGISGNCDMDYSYVDYASVIKEAGLNGFDSKLKEYRDATQARFGFTDGTMKFLDGHKTPEALYKKLATKG